MASTFSVPADLTVYAIGDVHGCLREMEKLLREIEIDLETQPGDGHLVFLGDLVDRGPDSAGVIQRLVEGRLPGTRQSFLLGNHEEAMLSVLNGDVGTLPGWLKYGGLETLESYGVKRGEVLRLGSDLPARLREIVPPSHVAFLEGFDNQVRIGDYLFVHAGIRPGVPLDQQDAADLRWIRSEFLDDEDTEHGVMVVHGHTVSEAAEVRANRIGIDTGCYKSGRLTALVLQGAEKRFLST